MKKKLIVVHIKGTIVYLWINWHRFQYFDSILITLEDGAVSEYKIDKLKDLHEIKWLDKEKKRVLEKNRVVVFITAVIQHLLPIIIDILHFEKNR